MSPKDTSQKTVRTVDTIKVKEMSASTLRDKISNMLLTTAVIFAGLNSINKTW